MLVSNWRDVLARSWAVWCAYLGLALPEVIDWGMRWLWADASAGLSPQAKNCLRAIALAAVIVARPLRQKSLQPPEIEPLKQ